LFSSFATIFSKAETMFIDVKPVGSTIKTIFYDVETTVCGTLPHFREAQPIFFTERKKDPRIKRLARIGK
jgi:hypothetical protein